MDTWDDAAVVSLMELGSGWLTPEGRVLPCAYYAHMQIALSSGCRLPLDTPVWFEAIELLKAQGHTEAADFASCQDEDDHPCWHVFDSFAGDEASVQRARLMGAMHQMGWVRLGIWKSRESLDVYGCASVLARRRGVLKDIAGFLNLTLEKQSLRSRIENLQIGAIGAGCSVSHQ